MRERLQHAWRAAAFTYDLVCGDRDTWVKRAAGPVETASGQVTSRGRTLRYDVYRCGTSASPPRPALVVIHGFTHQGTQDPRLQALCQRLARAGFVVTVPEFEEMRQYRLGLGDTTDLEAAVAALAAHPEVDTARVGIMAFSFGAAPALIGLSRPPLKDSVRFALIFGGYFDLRRTFRYVLTGAYDGFGYSGRLVPPRKGDDRWKFLRGNLGMIPPSPTSHVLEAAVHQRVADPDAAVDVSACSPDERAAFALIENRDPARYETLFAAAGAHIHEWIRRLSPAHVADGITAKLFLVHSFTDQKTPFIESIAMSRGVPNAPPPTLVLLNAFAHVDLRLDWRSLRSLARDGLPGLTGVWRVVHGVLRETRTSWRAAGQRQSPAATKAAQ
jgi:hypothetical protein